MVCVGGDRGNRLPARRCLVPMQPAGRTGYGVRGKAGLARSSMLASIAWRSRERLRGPLRHLAHRSNRTTRRRSTLRRRRHSRVAAIQLSLPDATDQLLAVDKSKVWIVAAVDSTPIFRFEFCTRLTGFPIRTYKCTVNGVRCLICCRRPGTPLLMTCLPFICRPVVRGSGPTLKTSSSSLSWTAGSTTWPPGATWLSANEPSPAPSKPVPSSERWQISLRSS
jgi:hypothetical protein